MKTYKHLFEKICSPDNLKSAFKKAKKGNGNRAYVKDFETNLDANLMKLKCELESLTYRPRPLRPFVIHDPKTRLISAPHFRDRVVHHALCNIIEPIFDRIFIHDSYASRKGRGTHAALRRFEMFKRRVSCNGRPVNRAKDSNMVTGHALKADIRHYYASVNHGVMIRIIGRRIKDEKVLWLIRKILDSHCPKNPGKGMPIGSLTSQLFANIYLSELDCFIKQRLRAKFYIRYMDDFIILHKSRGILLGWKGMISGFLRTIKLELHQEKSAVFPLHKGVSFLGYRIFFNYKLLKKGNLGVLEKKMEKFKKLFDRGEISHGKIMQSLEGWMAYARYGNTYNLRRRLMAGFGLPFYEKPAEPTENPEAKA